MQPQVDTPASAAATEYNLRYAIDAALASGITAAEIQDMVAQRTAATTAYAGKVESTTTDPACLLDRNADGGERIYLPDEVPDGLIDLPTASRKYEIPVHTLRMWVYRGKLPHRGRVRDRAPGGGYILTEDIAIPYCRDNPRKSGPKKSSV